MGAIDSAISIRLNARIEISRQARKGPNLE